MQQHPLRLQRLLRFARLAPLALTLTLLGAAPLAACGQVDAGTVGASSENAARSAVARGALLLDVRTPGEFSGGHLDGASNIPVEELERRKAEIAAGREVVVYCRSGRRSARAAEILRASGHTVIDIETMDNW